MTAPNGRPSQAKPLQYRDFEPGDAAVQAGAGEATVRGTDQDVTQINSRLNRRSFSAAQA